MLKFTCECSFWESILVMGANSQINIIDFFLAVLSEMELCSVMTL